MVSPEHTFWPPEFFAPDTGSGRGSGGSVESEHPQLSGIDFGDRATWNHVVSVVHELEKYDALADANHVLGLPENTTWHQIEYYVGEQDYRYLARDYGLPDNAPRTLIEERLANEEEHRLRRKLLELGLPEDATAKEIDEKERAIRARNVDLPENSSWPDIWKVEKEQKRRAVLRALGMSEDTQWNWEEIVARALCISGVATAEDYIRRIRQVREWHIHELVTRGAVDIT